MFLHTDSDEEPETGTVDKMFYAGAQRQCGPKVLLKYLSAYVIMLSTEELAANYSRNMQPVEVAGNSHIKNFHLLYLCQCLVANGYDVTVV